MRVSVLETVSSHLSASTPSVELCAGKATAVPEDLKRFLDTFRGLTKVKQRVLCEKSDGLGIVLELLVVAALSEHCAEEKKNFFSNRFPKELTDELTSKYEQEPYVQEWVKHMMYYTIPGGKMNRGLTVMHSLAALKVIFCFP